MKLYEAGESSAALKISECFTLTDELNFYDSFDETLPQLMTKKDANGKL